MSADTFLLSPDQEPVSPYLSAMTEPPPETPVLTDDVQADVAIVGAGFTGLSAALSLAETGVSVRVVDAHHAGWGGSGRAWGQVAAVAKFMPSKVERDLGAEVGGRVNRAAATAPDLVFGLIRQHGMRCSEVHTGNLISAHTKKHEAELAATAEDLQKRGHPVELLSTAETQRFTGSKRYSVALLDRRGGALNPLGYARGLARAALQAGARIHGGTPALRLESRDGGWRVHTPKGKVTTDAVILATNAFGSDQLFPGLGRAVMPMRAYQAVSEPIPAAVRGAILPGGQPLNDTRKLFSGVRVWPDGRLHIGVDGPPFSMKGQADLRGAQARIAMMYPELAGLRWAYTWGGWVDMTDDQYPRIHRLAPQLWTAFGFSGRGIGIGTLMGRDLAALARGASADDVVHPVTPLRELWYHALHRPMLRSLVQYYRVLDAWNDHRFGAGVH